jgi:polyhydroxyalkanoate synthesis regulator phasin
MKVEKSPTVANWLGRLGEGSRRSRIYEFGYFMGWVAENGGKFAGMTPDELITYQKAATNSNQYDVLDMVQRYVQGFNGRLGTKKLKVGMIRSFFLHNRAPLPQDPSFNLRGDRPPVFGELKPEEIKAVVLSSRPMYQAIFLCMLEGAMDQESLLYWSTNGLAELREDLEKGSGVIKVKLPGRKSMRNERPFYTLIGGDAKRALEKWMSERPRDGGDSIFIDQFGGPLAKSSVKLYWRNHMRRIGLIPTGKPMTERFGKSLHELRDTFRTQWSLSGAAPHIGEYLMGHVVDDLGYDKSPNNEAYVLSQYRKALPYLNVMSSSVAHGLTSEERVRELEEELERIKTQKDVKQADIERQLEETRRGQDVRVAELEMQVERLARLVEALTDREGAHAP